MKIALCISGHLRNYSILKNNFDEFKAYCESFGHTDVFVAAWDKLSTSHSWSAAHNLTKQENINTSVSFEQIQDHYQTNDILIFDDHFYGSEYSPLKYYFFTTNKYSWDNRGINNDIVHSTRMFFLINQANMLKLKKEYLNQTRYDLVLRIRPDMVFHPEAYTNLNLLEIAEAKKIFVVPHKVYHKSIVAYCDRFIIAKSELMDKVCSVIYNISIPFNKNIFGDPEDVLLESIHNIIPQQDIIFIDPIENILGETDFSLR